MEFQFCPKCGSKSEKKADNLLVCPDCEFNFYVNPSPTSAVILENQKGEILLVVRKFEPFKGYLDLPGGFVEPGETLEESVSRESKEEIRVEVSDIAYLGSYPDEYMYMGINIKTLGFVLTGKINDEANLKPADDVAQIIFFPKDKIPFEKIAFENVRKGLLEYLNKKA